MKKKAAPQVVLTSDWTSTLQYHGPKDRGHASLLFIRKSVANIAQLLRNSVVPCSQHLVHFVSFFSGISAKCFQMLLRFLYLQLLESSTSSYEPPPNAGVQSNIPMSATSLIDSNTLYIGKPRQRSHEIWSWSLCNKLRRLALATWSKPHMSNAILTYN